MRFDASPGLFSMGLFGFCQFHQTFFDFVTASLHKQDCRLVEAGRQCLHVVGRRDRGDDALPSDIRHCRQSGLHGSCIHQEWIGMLRPGCLARSACQYWGTGNFRLGAIVLQCAGGISIHKRGLEWIQLVCEIHLFADSAG